MILKVKNILRAVSISVSGQVILAPFGQLANSKVVTTTLTGVQTREAHASVEDFAEGFRNSIDVAVDFLGRLYVADYKGG